MNPSATYRLEADDKIPARAVELASAAVTQARRNSFQVVARHADAMGDSVEAYIHLSEQHLGSEFRKACAAKTKIFIERAGWELPLFLLLSLVLAFFCLPFYLGFPEAKSPLGESARSIVAAAFLAISGLLVCFIATVVRLGIIPAVKDFSAGITKGQVDTLKSEAAVLWGIGNKGIHVWGRVAEGENVRPCKTVHYQAIGEVRDFENKQNGYGLMVMDLAGNVCCAIEDVGGNQDAVEMLKARSGHSKI